MLPNRISECQIQLPSQMIKIDGESKLIILEININISDPIRQKHASVNVFRSHFVLFCLLRERDVKLSEPKHVCRILFIYLCCDTPKHMKRLCNLAVYCLRLRIHTKNLLKSFRLLRNDTNTIRSGLFLFSCQKSFAFYRR